MDEELTEQQQKELWVDQLIALMQGKPIPMEYVEEPESVPYKIDVMGELISEKGE